MADMIRGVCPQCGKKLEIPAELEEFSCLYCGARMRTEALRAKPVETGTVEALLAQLPGCITRYPDLHLRIGKKDFFPTFAQYEQDNAPLLQELDACCAGYPGGAEALAGHAAAVMLDGLAAHMEKDPRWGKRTRDNVFFDTKVALAIFFTPLLRKLSWSWPSRCARSCRRSGSRAGRSSCGGRATMTHSQAGSRSSASASSRRRRVPPRASPTTARS